MSERPKRDADEGTPYVMINGQQIDGRDPCAIDEAFRKIAQQRDRLVASLEKHFHKAET